ncbi:dihydroorotase [Fuerstiella marisgermanici]|uniref:Dihydroorotase n=1 Tax=Fuerstiella marisgermanici TaxID=1891926 RepID=A0A1P8W9R3_9PLAN|nr:dihydroorotase [Fuerstiella marisgermanici]APZ90794.1 Dihydroorotase [Fuerstiella marisgermanici]
MRTLIQNGTIVDPANGIEARRELLIADGKVVEVLPQGQQPDADRVIDATGLLVCPGFIDVHVGVREPGFDEDETIASATAAALAGGFTSIAALPDTNPVVDNRGSAEFVKRQAERANNCRVFPLGAVTKGTRGEELAEIGQLVEADAVAFTDAKSPIANAEVMRRALEYTGMFDRPILHHSMVPELSDTGVMHEGFQSTRLGLRGIPAAANDIMTGRDIALAELTGGRVHIMCVNTQETVERIRLAQGRTVAVSADVTPHHLLLTDEVMDSFDTLFKCNPPLRSQEHIDALIEGLKDGTIAVISSDHQPLAIEKKDVDLDSAPFGICGLETTLALCVKALIQPAHLSWSQLVACLTTGPAALLGIPHGTLSPDVAADVTLVDPIEEWTIDAASFRSRSRNTPFNGWKVTGRVVTTIVNGEVRHSTRA